MSRRVSLPAADDLFRPTAPAAQPSDPEPAPKPARAPRKAAAKKAAPRAESPTAAAVADEPAERTSAAPARRPSGRVRHDEKMTVYITSDELLDLEHARLSLRRTHGLAVDRGRLVRQAIAMALADLEAHGEDSQLVQRLREA
ncbi:hypothetical protein NODU109028_03025 [Nocardioides dubius]|uniref:Cobyrinic acid a,c-diamide synthase n=1 Tax=Nocardioides dubius TaxID=317019 RepID=A0ABN1TM38_9ACTN